MGAITIIHKIIENAHISEFKIFLIKDITFDFLSLYIYDDYR